LSSHSATEHERRSVFLASSAEADLGLLRSVLAETGVSVVTPDAPSVGEFAGDALVDAVTRATFVLVVLTDSTLPAAVLFEVGVASARKRPLAVLDARSRKIETSDTEFALAALTAAPTLGADLTDKAALRSELQNFLSGVLTSSGQRRPQRHVEATQPAFVNAETEMPTAELRSAEALRKLGARVVLQPGGSRGGPDMAASWAELGPLFDPVLVEVAGLRARLRQKRAALAAAMTTAGAHLGLVVALDAVEVSTELTSATTTVVTLSLRELETTDRQAFLRLLGSARNQLIHGG
jgi:hypothetical protein